MKKNRYISIICLLLLSISLNAQIDSISFMEKVYKQDRKLAEYERTQDSLRTEFIKRPPIVDIGFEIDRQKIELKENFDFWYEKNGTRFCPQEINNKQFLVDTISDTLSFVLRFEMDTLRFTNIGFGWIRNGADFRFGKVEKLDEIRNYYKKHRNDEDFNKWIDIGQPYLRLIENKKLKRQISKVRSIHFLVITPYVFGDPAIMEIVNVNPKYQ